MLSNDIVAFDFDVSRGRGENDPVYVNLDVELASHFAHLDAFQFLFWPVGGDQIWTTASRVPGTDRFVAAVELSTYATSGFYEVRKIVLSDSSGNQVDVTDDQLSTLGFNPAFEFTNPNGDEEPPLIEFISVGEPLFNDDETISVEIDLRASDNLSGLTTRALLEVVGPGGESYFAEANLSDNNGSDSFSFNFPKFSTSGFYTINTVRLYDNALNATLDYDPQQHQSVAGFTIDNPNSDPAGPQLEKIEVRGAFDLVTGRPTLNYEIEWSDDRSGVAESYLRVYLPGSGHNDRWLDVSNGRSSGTIALVSPSAEGVYGLSPFATDSAGNQSEWYAPSQLEAMGFQGNVHVFAPAENGYEGGIIASNDANSIVFGLHLADDLRGGNGNDQLLGGEGNDLLESGAGHDRVEGGSGNDLLVGGSGEGDDVYDGGRGHDTIRYTSAVASIHVDLSAGTASGIDIGTDALSEVESIVGGQGDDHLTGNAGANILNGFGGDDILDGGDGGDSLVGGAGSDRLIGGLGNDRFYVDDRVDEIVEGDGGGSDRVYAGISYVLSARAEIEILSTADNAGTAVINLTGNEYANYLQGNAGNNILDGRGGIDTFYGLGGNDSYFVNHAAERVIENVGDGTDRVYAGVSYRLAEGVHVEILSTGNNAGTTAINLTGNSLSNYLQGNAGNNVLDGGGGIDSFYGLGGNDSFFVDNAAERVIEDAGSGNDRVYASVSYTLGAAAEIEILSTSNNAGTAAIDLTGNGHSNYLQGNAGNNRLDGKGGIDSFYGLGGNDSFFVDHAAERVIENVGGGNDRVYASVSYTLGAAAEIEILSTADFAGTAAINLTGSGFANYLQGNAGDNVLDGKRGNDTLYGLGGADTFAFTTPLGVGNIDKVIGFDTAHDQIWLESDVFEDLAEGALAVEAFVLGASAGEADDRIIYNPETGALLFDTDGSGAAAAIRFASIDPLLNLTNGEFVII